MLKTIGAGLIFVSCSGIGFRIARNFRERPRELRMLMHGLRVLRGDIEYQLMPLPNALERAADRCQAPIQRLFQVAAEALQGQASTVTEALEIGISQVDDKSALKRQDWDVLREFGNTLGSSDRYHQSQHFDVALHRLDGLEQDARLSQQTHERLWQYVGVLSGLLIVVLLY